MIRIIFKRPIARFTFTVLTAALLSAGLAPDTVKAQAMLQDETKSLDALYEEALAEGGDLVVYAGGDIAAQQEGTVKAFQARFPKMRLRMVVDYSKFHDVRVDQQIFLNRVVADVVQLQTLQNFPRWKQQGKLLQYRPAGFSNVYSEFKDSDAAWSSVGVIAFSYLYDPEAIGNSVLTSPKDLADPAWRGKMASSYPNDDDAALFLYKLYAETYGWDWIAKMAMQNIQFARGTHSPGAAVRAHEKVIGLAASGSLTAPATAPTRWAVHQGQPFLAWGQRAAILKGAPHPAAAKLYMNWQLSPERQQAAANGWSVRTDIAPAGGLKPIWTYANAHITEFINFMSDRAEVERWRQTFTLYFGEFKGAPSPGWLGLDIAM